MSTSSRSRRVGTTADGASLGVATFGEALRGSVQPGQEWTIDRPESSEGGAQPLRVDVVEGGKNGRGRPG